MSDNLSITKRISDIRLKYGPNIYITIVSDDILIPWKLLPIIDYMKYFKDINERKLPISIFEDDIFSKCVLDESLIRQMPFLKAGIISTVVENIWSLSCLNTAEEINNSLQEARNEQQNILPAIRELVDVIILAFPSYKPNEIFSMDYTTLINTAIYAERKLLQTEVIKEQIFFESKDRPETNDVQQPSRPDPRQLWEEQNTNRNKRPKRRGIDNLFRQLHGEKEKKSGKKSNIIEALDKGVTPLLTDKEIKNQAKNEAFVGSGHDMIDRDIHTHNMIEEAKVIYADVLEELKKRREKNKNK